MLPFFARSACTAQKDSEFAMADAVTPSTDTADLAQYCADLPNAPKRLRNC